METQMPAVGSDDDRVLRFEALGSDDVPRVGGKNASLGEMIRSLGDAGIRVPPGFATTAAAYREFLEANDLRDPIRSHLEAWEVGRQPLAEAGSEIRELFLAAEFPGSVADAIRRAYRELAERIGLEEPSVAVRSSATAEDLPEASFAGQLESLLNVRGEAALLETCRRCYASLFTDRAMSYWREHGFGHLDVALSVGVQQMVRADLAGAGVLFTLDTDTGFPDVVLVNAAWGLGESVVQGTVNPDQYTVFKPLLDREDFRPIIGQTVGEKAEKVVYAEDADATTATVLTTEEERRAAVLTDDEILRLARWGVRIKEHYGRPMDVEWAKDGVTGELFIVQARPETVQSRERAFTLRRYRLLEEGEELLQGLAIGNAVAAAEVCVLESAAEIDRFREGAILVTGSTDPDWVPVMRQAAGIVTDHGGRTSHAAIVSRELGVPAVVGTGDATRVLEDRQEVTLSCAGDRDGRVYRGLLEYEAEELDLEDVPETRTRIMMNVASPVAAMRWWRLPCRGVGLARMEYVINNVIQVHPLALTRFDEVEDPEARARIEEMTRGYEDRTEYFVDELARGLATIAASRHPDPVLVRTSDFKTNEYAELVGGRQFEPAEDNPMLGWRGAARYYSDEYRDGFALECRAIRRVRGEMGLENVVVLIPFCRTPAEADRVLEVLAENGLRRGEHGLEVWVMAELPSNVVRAADFAERFDGFSIGTNDLTQLVLGVDRDSERLAYLFDERESAVTDMISTLVDEAHAHGRPVGICGQAPSDHPEFADFLVRAGIDSISLNADSVLEVTRRVAEVEAEIEAGGAEEALPSSEGLPSG
jgi:pyruvate,water dikinase